MLKSIFWWLLTLCFLRNMAAPPDNGETSGSGYVTSLFSIITAIQIQSMTTGKDLLQLNIDDYVNRNNHEIVTAFMKLSRRLHALEKLGLIFTTGIAALRKTPLEHINQLAEMVTTMCTYLERELKEDKNLYPEYLIIKDELKKNTTEYYTGSVYFEKLPRTPKELLKALTKLMDSKQAKLSYCNSQFFYCTNLHTSIDVDTYVLAKAIITAAQNVEVRDPLQRCYDEALNFMTERMSVTLKGLHQKTLVTLNGFIINQTEIGPILMGKLTEKLYENTFLKQTIDKIKVKVLTAEVMKHFKLH